MATVLGSTESPLCLLLPISDIILWLIVPKFYLKISKVYLTSPLGCLTDTSN